MEFALILPALVALSALIIDFTIWMFDFHRSNEASRRVARLMTLSVPLVDQADLEVDGIEVCTGAGCDAMAALLAEAQTIQPRLTADNIQVTYEIADIGGVGSSEGYKVLITTELINIQHNLLMLPAVPGVPDYVTYSATVTNSMTRWY
ncbi:TadE family protein [Kiloniella sp.]|uniref:TadE family protein n=1 Tax=Kiloniella sp. TaxID=1938587 RepID=UPI003B01753E